MQLYESLTAVLDEAATANRSIRFIDGDKDESIVTFAELWRRARSMLGALQARGMRPGDELILFTKSNERFVVAFWAAVLGGIVPVPVAVGISDEHRLKLFRILRQLQRRSLYTEAALLERLVTFARDLRMPDVLAILTEAAILDTDIAGQEEGRMHTATAEDTAFIQYSSGSTGEPKGICLSHRNLTTNIRAIIECGHWSADDVSVSWMPLTHDMGLIGYHLSVLAAGMDHAIMDTNLFVRRPLLWARKASDLAATQLCSPNFGYKHFLKLFERKGLENLDLSPVRLILNGAEPISWELCEEFLAALAPYGLKRTTMFPVYGLAEATVAVSFPTPGTEYSRIVVHRHRLRIGAPYRVADPDDADAVSFVKVGRAVRDCRIRIAGDNDLPLADGLVGNIQVAGDNVTEGLYSHGAEEGEMFTADRWLRTGDCGVFVDGELVITGRSKDIIIVNGQNYYPHDIEQVIAKVGGLDLGKVVVCSVSKGHSQAEELLVFLLYRQDLGSFRMLADEVRSMLGTQTGLEADHVIPVTRIPKTTSGKVQRSQLAAAYVEGEFDDAIAAIQPPPPEALLGDDSSADGLITGLLKICQEVAKERAIGPDDNLFEVGVSSLTLTEIVLAIDEQYPGRLDISDLFDHPTIRDVAGFIRR